MAQDYPDGMTRMLPGHTVDLETGFARPWYEGSSVVIAAGASGSYTLDFEDDDGIYYIDVVNVSPSAYTEFTVIVHINDVPYVCGSVMGFFFFNLRLNPSLLFISGDSVKVEILNLDAAQQTFSVKLQGTKITRPVGFGKCPGAYYTASPLIGFSPLSVTFTDGSTYSPTSWEWKANGASVDSTEQNPIISIVSTGLISPILKATNQYGYDTYARADYIRSLYCIPTSDFTEVDAGGYIAFSGDTVTITNIIKSARCFVYRDYGADYFDEYELYAHMKITSCASAGGVVVLGVSTSNAGTPAASSTSVFALVYNDSGTVYLYIETYTNTTLSDWARIAISLNTNYYIKMVHETGSNDVNLYLYSDANFSTLVTTLNSSHASNATKKRYMYSGGSFDSGSSTAKTSAVIYKRAVIIP